MSSAQLQRSRWMVVNGDDFGFSSSINHAIIAAHQEGILTSASLMVSGDAFEEAVLLAKAHPTLAVGLHLVLACGRSVLPSTRIPHLVDAEGCFSYESAKAGLHYHLNQAARRELPLEIRAQLEKFRQTGLPLSHVDGHVHIHAQPIVLRHLVQFADEFQIRFIRLPFEDLRLALKVDRSDLFDKILWWSVFGGLRAYGESHLKSSGIRFVDRVYGVLHSGRMTEDYLLGLIPQMRANLVEIYSHPMIATPEELGNRSVAAGWAEWDALMSDRVRDAIAQHGFKLTNYLQLSQASPS